MKRWILAALLGWGLLAGAPARAEPAQLARQLCASCHGADGNGPGPAPRLAGQQAGYIEQQWQAFRLHQRADGGAHGAAMAALKSEGDIKALAAYFAAQPPAPARSAGGDPALLAAGRKLYVEGNLAVGTPPCFSCHGDRGEGGSAAPRLAGQHAAYLARRMRVSDAPQPDSAMEMQEILKTMSADDIKALLGYLATL
ncbi:c-type cytochrome [Chromobacterium piscinae]|uniref:c-type cytochrome n=1 Tax=Chromobacterium piscinae TaxID=686831 RepID=UPI001E5793E2|nr:c-type cytochrome [Chromobacterium piscinae]MCD5327783.1 c-type cytochrome [Chromobacterium piscinae]